MWRVSGIISPEQERDGFAVFEDDHLVYIKRFNEVCLVFSSSGATKKSIWEAIECIRKGGHATGCIKEDVPDSSPGTRGVEITDADKLPPLGDLPVTGWP